ncbi:hypothetical protein FJ934_20635 [Mesorhizobium sp. B2-4-12]|uniref:hypothetical protein n=1 Tax=unclassified Mesorhizobium TaxID=325217 RepID=UPI0011276B7F|nr:MULTISPECIES: hypothetical protein [unclassified Mesorhizobium]TPK83026.1 hypothetical protein FJ548_19410 [Mesorhizobium sp. B2-4-17]TPK92685.1 hypothetical protein FJ934_20635 [Mesorhizobium sp. B2-4-12]TPL07869.1 hypothetical protein FJ938_09685 [Mesorhizobium sp. B2-4-14]
MIYADWPAPNSDSVLEEIDGFNRRRPERPDGIKDALTLKGLSFVENYLEGRLWIALKYRPCSALEGNKFGLLGMLNCEAKIVDASPCFRAGAIDKFKPFYSHARDGGNKDDMFVGDVEPVESVQSELPSFVRLYLIQDDRDDLVAWRQSLLFLSVDGTFKRLPILAEWEASVFAEVGGVGVGDDVVRVIKGNSQIMERITKDCGSVFGKRGLPWGLPRLQPSVIALGPQTLHVITDVVPENDFELADVIVGPFNL